MVLALRELFLPIALLLAGIFADARPVFAARHGKTWSWDEILAPPIREPGSYACNATHPVRVIPDFGDGLVATYTFVGSGNDQSIRDRVADFTKHTNHAADNARAARLALPKTIPPRGAFITVEDNVVLTNIDDLLYRYASVCGWNREPPLVLQSIAYHPASLRERAEAPVRESWYYLRSLPIPPLPIAVNTPGPDFMPLAVPGGDYRFATSFDPSETPPGLIPMGEGYKWPFDPSKVAIGAGVRLAALFLGHMELIDMKPLADDGFDVLTIEDGGRIETLVIDRHVLVSADQLAARTKQVMRYQSFTSEMRLTRLDFYPAVLGGIDALRTDQDRALKDQLATLHGLELAEAYTRLMTYPPYEEDTEPLLKAKWSKFGGSATGSGYDAIFGGPGSTFGKLESISCEPDDMVFDCKAGVTFTVAEHPKYAERMIYFERHQRESGFLELEPADMRAPAYDPLRVSTPPPATNTSIGPQTIPTIPEVQQLIAAGWTHAPASLFTGQVVGGIEGTGNENFASEFSDNGDLSTTFGEVHDLACTERDSVFTCKIGVTYMRDGVPRYRQNGYQLFQRVRDADGAWTLKVYLETDIIVTDAGRSAHR
jgi:hypothetical protein